jgi:hypothetical protein
VPILTVRLTAGNFFDFTYSKATFNLVLDKIARFFLSFA